MQVGTQQTDAFAVPLDTKFGARAFVIDGKAINGVDSGHGTSLDEGERGICRFGVGDHDPAIRQGVMRNAFGIE
jgi:hypothetical protein